MSTTVVFSGTGDGFIDSTATVYATAANGSTFTVRTVETDLYLGQEFSGSNYYCDVGYVGFDTSSIDDTDTVSAECHLTYSVVVGAVPAASRSE